MFFQRLDSAKEEAKEDAKDITPGRPAASAPSSSDGSQLADRMAKAADDGSPDPKGAVARHAQAGAKGQPPHHQQQPPNAGDRLRDEDDPDAHAEEDDEESIVKQMSEWLFDLWDANCTPEFKEVEAFENRAYLSFDPDQDEFTFEQEALHKEFCELFERLTGEFLKERGYTAERFYEEVRRFKEQGRELSDTNEVCDVIWQVSDLTVWAEEMKERARRQAMHIRKWPQTSS